MLDMMPEAWENQKFTADGVVCDDPCYLKSLEVRSGTGGIGVATIYSGESPNGTELTCVTAATSRDNLRQFEIPLFCPKGIYLDLGTNADHAHVRFQRKGKE